MSLGGSPTPNCVRCCCDRHGIKGSDSSAGALASRTQAQTVQRADQQSRTPKATQASLSGGTGTAWAKARRGHQSQSQSPAGDQGPDHVVSGTSTHWWDTRHHKLRHKSLFMSMSERYNTPPPPGQYPPSQSTRKLKHRFVDQIEPSTLATTPMQRTPLKGCIVIELASTEVA